MRSASVRRVAGAIASSSPNGIVVTARPRPRSRASRRAPARAAPRRAASPARPAASRRASRRGGRALVSGRAAGGWPTPGRGATRGGAGRPARRRPVATAPTATSAAARSANSAAAVRNSDDAGSRVVRSGNRRRRAIGRLRGRDLLARDARKDADRDAADGDGPVGTRVGETGQAPVREPVERARVGRLEPERVSEVAPRGRPRRRAPRARAPRRRPAGASCGPPAKRLPARRPGRERREPVLAADDDRVEAEVPERSQGPVEPPLVLEREVAHLAAREPRRRDRSRRRIGERDDDAAHVREALLPRRILDDDRHDVPAEGAQPCPVRRPNRRQVVGEDEDEAARREDVAVAEERLEPELERARRSP